MCVDWVSDNFAWWCEVARAIIIVVVLIIIIIIIMLRWSGQDRTIGI